jgi:Tol biopolymer transport system component
MSLGNPYIVDRPLAEGDPFFGRYNLLVGVAQGVRRGRQLVLVYGPARTGKTSFLRQLMKGLAADFLVVSVQLAWPENGSPSQVMQGLRASIAEELTAVLGEPVPDLVAALAALRDREAVILIDGLSVTDLCGDPGADFVAQLQGFMARTPAVRFVLTVDGMPAGASLLNPALASLPSLELEPFTLEETEETLLRPATGRLTFDFAAMRRIWQLTSGHPYFVQLFGYLLFIRHAVAGRVGLHGVDEIVADVLAAAHPIMDRIWQSCSSQTRVLLSLTNELQGRHGVLTVGELRDSARQQGAPLSDEAIEAGMQELLAVGVLRRLSADSYSFYSDLFRQWLSKYKPLAAILEALSMKRRLPMFATSRPWRPFSWRSAGLWLAAVGMLSAIIVLWNMRGSARRVAMESSPSATPSPFATRATLVIGPALGRIAYMAKDDPDAMWDVWVMRADGSDPQRLTEDPAHDMSPGWSPDGEFIAFVSERDGNREIYVMKADGTQQINLTHHPSEDWSPAWSADGSSIAFSSYRDGNWEIYVMGGDGSNPVRLTQNSAADYGPCWSPDSQQIAFHSNRDGNWEIYVVDRDGEGLRRLTEDEATDFAPAWSPDGRTVAFESYRDGNMEIYLMAADGSDVHSLSNEPYSNEHGPAWARDGTRLLYFSNRDGGWDIFSMRPDGTEKTNLTLSPNLEQGPRWHE